MKWDRELVQESVINMGKHLSVAMKEVRNNSSLIAGEEIETLRDIIIMNSMSEMIDILERMDSVINISKKGLQEQCRKVDKTPEEVSFRLMMSQIVNDGNLNKEQLDELLREVTGMDMS